MNKIICDSFTEIIQHYLSHSQLDDLNIEHILISHDIPSELCIGFSCCNEHFLIKISALKGRKHTLKDQKYSELLKDNLLTSKGRMKLASIIRYYVKTSLNDLDKYLELKAFW